MKAHPQRHPGPIESSLMDSVLFKKCIAESKLLLGFAQPILEQQEHQVGDGCYGRCMELKALVLPSFFF